jgi:hypothetical protein
MLLTWGVRRSKDAALAALVGASCVAVVAPPPGAAAAKVPEVRARLIVPPHLAPGGTATVAVEMTLAPGLHVNSHAVTLRYLIPTTLTLAASNGTLSVVRYPKHVEKTFEFLDVPLAVYEGTVRFESELTLPATASGTVVVTGVLAYQACDDHQCFQPVKAAVSAAVAVAGAEIGER